MLHFQLSFYNVERAVDNNRIQCPCSKQQYRGLKPSLMKTLRKFQIIMIANKLNYPQLCAATDYTQKDRFVL